jgi:translation elongation factor EF-G
MGRSAQFRRRGKTYGQYPTEKIRNVCFLGHGGSGKTSLAESILF